MRPALSGAPCVIRRCLAVSLAGLRFRTVTPLVLLILLLLGEGQGADAGWPSTERPAPLHGPHPFVTILCRFAGPQVEPVPPSHFAWLLSDRYPGLGDYWRTVSYGAISLEGSALVGWYTLPKSRSAYVPGIDRDDPRSAAHADPDLQRLAQDCAGAAGGDVDWSRYVGINLVFSEELGDNWGGQACLDLAGARRCYSATWIGPLAYDNQAIWAHEMGHAFGLLHSGSIQNAYANIWDIMSAWGPCWPEQPYGQVAQEPIAYNKDLLGWIPPDRQFSAPRFGETHVTLAQLASPSSDGYLLGWIPIDGSPWRFYTVEARRRTGYDVHLPGNAVVIHEVDTRRSRPASPVAPPPSRLASGQPEEVLAAGWTPGSIFTDAQHAIAVSIDEATVNGFAVTIYTGPTRIPLVRTTKHVAASSPGNADSSTATDAHGNEYKTWTAVPPGNTPGNIDGGVLYARRTPGGIWSSAEQVSEPGQGSHHLRPAIAVDGAGNAYVAWEDNRRGSFDIYFAFRPDNGAWRANTKVNDDAGGLHLQPAVAANSAGEAVIVWVDYRGEHPSIYSAYRPASGRWGTSIRASDVAAGKATEPAVTMDGAGNAYSAWIGYPVCSYRGFTPASVYLSARPAAHGSSDDAVWHKPVLVREGTSPLSRPRLAIDDEGILHVLWEEGGLDRQATFPAAELLPP